MLTRTYVSTAHENARDVFHRFWRESNQARKAENFTMVAFRFRNVCVETYSLNLPETEVTSAALEDRLAPLYERLKIPFGTLEKLSGIKARRFWSPETLPSEVATAAAEHGSNIAVVNMDWKSARHAGREWENTHAPLWRRTTTEIIRGYDPAVICFCEVGEVSNPLKDKYFDDLKDLTRRT